MLFATEHFVYPLHSIDLLWRVAGPTHADEIDARNEIHFGDGKARRHIARGAGIAGKHGMMPDPAELMHPGVAAEHDTVFNGDVASEQGTICKQAVRADDAVVAGVRVHHEVVVVGNRCRPGISHGAVNRDRFAKRIAIADDDAAAGLIVVEADRLRREANRDKRVQPVVCAESDRSVDVDVAAQLRTRSQGNGAKCAIDDALRPDDDIVGKRNVTFNAGGWMHVRHGESVSRAAYACLMTVSKGQWPCMIPLTSFAEPFDLEVRDLGRIRYHEALDLQRALQADVIAQRQREAGLNKTMYLLLVEHDPPVITVSQRKEARQHLITSEAQLAEAGIEVAETDRGGDITYHGPGQLVVYPILDLNIVGLRLHGYMRLLEEVVIATIGAFGVRGARDTSATGVWVNNGTAKICAMGVRVSRWVSMHGLALNVTTNLDHFQHIIPCGLSGRAVSSLERELRDRAPSMSDVKCEFVDQFIMAVEGLQRTS